MSSFVYDALTPPDGKTNARNLVGPAAQSVTAEEWNAVMQYLEDIRTAIISGDYSGLTDYEAPVSGNATARLRFLTDRLQASVDQSRYYTVAEKEPSVFNVRDFGAVGDGVTNDYPAFAAAITAMAPGVWPSAPGRILRVPPGTYKLNSTLHLTRGMILEGTGGAVAGYSGSKLLFAAGVHGVMVDRYDTSPDNGAGDGAVIRDLHIDAAGKTTAVHGIYLRARAIIERCRIENFGGNGVHIAASTSGSLDALTPWASSTAYTVGQSVSNDSGKWYICKIAGTSASSGGPTGTSRTVVDGGVTWGCVVGGTNANNWALSFCRINTCAGHGLFVDGADANAGYAIGVDCSDNDGWGIYDSSFLGNTYVGCHVAANLTGAYKSDSTSARNLFLGCYSESGHPGSDILYPSMVIGGLHGAGVTGNGLRIFGNEATPMIYTMSDGGYIYLGDLGTKQAISLKNATDVLVSSLRFNAAAYTAYPRTVSWNWGSVTAADGHGMGSEQGLFNAGGVLRYLAPTQLFTGNQYGLINEGQRISHGDDPLALTAATQRSFAVGDIVMRRTPVAGGFAGWLCTVAGTCGTYTEGLTCTSAGSTSLTLSAATSTQTGIHVGDKLLINGVTTVTVTAVSSLLTLTVSGSVPAGSGLSIAYVAPTFTEFGPAVGTASDSTGTPGAATQNTRTGRAAIAAGANSVTITNSKVTASSIVTAVLQTVDATLTALPVVVCGSGSFTVYGNANATAACNLGWVLQ